MGIQKIHRVFSVDEAIQSLCDAQYFSRILSGGVGITLALRNGKLDCDQLIDISGIKALQTVEDIFMDDVAYLKLGAGFSLRQLEKNTKLQSAFPNLAAVLAAATDPARRNAFTLGGRLASRRCPGMVLPALAALDALVVTQNKSGEIVTPIMTWLHEDQENRMDLITAVLVPKVALPVWEMEQAKRRQMPGEMVAGVLVAGDLSDGKVRDLRLVSKVDTSGVQRWTALEQLVIGKEIDDGFAPGCPRFIGNPTEDALGG